MSGSGTFGRIWRWVKWPIIVLAVGYVATVIWGSFMLYNRDKTEAAVAAIHAQKITLADVEGRYLPPTPDQAENDATIAGIDKNNNGVRDDVELAIFKKYPTNKQARAAALQYAMTEQMYLTRVFNTETWKAVAEESGRAFGCVLAARADDKAIQSLVINTELRKSSRTKAFEYITSHGDAPGKACDVSF